MAFRRLWALLLLVPVIPACALLGLPRVDGCYSCDLPPAPPQAADRGDTRLIAMGDFGTDRGQRNAQVASVLRQYIDASAVPVERVIELGDNFYNAGLIGTDVACADAPGADAAVTDQALRVLQPFEFLRDRHITLTTIPGNHDYGCGSLGIENQVDVDRWLPAAHRWGSRWDAHAGLPQALDLADGSVQLILLDSERMLRDSAFLAASVERLQALLAGGKGRYRWRLLAAHHPLRTNGTHSGLWFQGTATRLGSLLLFPTHALAALRVPPFDELNEEAYSIRYVQYRDAIAAAIARSGVPVALFLAGHDHQLQLLDAAAPGQPLVLISGAAARCSPVRAGGDTLFAAPKNGFAALTVSPGHIDVDFIGTTDCRTAEPCATSDAAAPHALFHYRVWPAPIAARS